MILKRGLSLLLCLILWINPLLSSVITGTLIKTPDGHIAVERVNINDKITAYDPEKSLITSAITHITSKMSDTIIAITTHKGTFQTCPDQQFFDPIIQKWIAAQNITIDTVFLDAQLNICPCLHVESMHIEPITTYRITTTKPHTFFITEQELLAHNAFPFIIGLAWLFGGGLEFAGITLGTALLGSYVGVQLYNAQKQKAENCSIEFHIVPCDSPCPDPDDENKERVFNTITKTEFFKKIENDYERWRGNVYKRKNKAKGIEDAEYLEWDYTHNDVEVYAKNRWHMGSINPKTLKIYKPAVATRRLSK